MLAIISDIHANIEALEAVLADIGKRQVDRIVCLGDVIGYGPDPRACMDLVMEKASAALMGNHDFAVLCEPEKFNMAAELASFWTRQQLEEEPDEAKRNARWDFLGSLRTKHTLAGEEFGMGQLTFAHGSPRRPINEYIFPDDIYNNPGRVRGSFERIEGLCFVGHTHVPGVFLEAPDFYSPEELEGVFEVNPSHKVMVNVGSVGQPRDRDKRAGYVLIETGKVRFVRVSYDVDSVVRKVYAIPDLDDYLGSRLQEGR